MSEDVNRQIGRPKKDRGETRQTSIRLPVALLECVDIEAEARMVGRNWLIERLIVIGLANLPSRELKVEKRDDSVGDP